MECRGARMQGALTACSVFKHNRHPVQNVLLSGSAGSPGSSLHHFTKNTTAIQFRMFCVVRSRSVTSAAAGSSNIGPLPLLFLLLRLLRTTASSPAHLSQRHPRLPNSLARGKQAFRIHRKQSSREFRIIQKSESLLQHELPCSHFQHFCTRARACVSVRGLSSRAAAAVRRAALVCAACIQPAAPGNPN
jgi:hypothetical protein